VSARVPAPVRSVRFADAAAFRAWLARHHRGHAELVVRCYKVHAAHRGLTYRDAVLEALCFGWIDGITRRRDADSFSVRFTPRRRGSIWSRINVAHARRLARAGRMMPAGLAAFKARDPARTGVYSFERQRARFTPAMLARFRAARAAWADFQARPPWYQRTTTHWVMSAKRPETRERRLGVLIRSSAKGRTIPGVIPARRPRP
jgi:uncharacterized protein YdeI (YjbR/CyaY-like superfamily)